MKPALRSLILMTIRVAVLAGIGAGSSCTRDTPPSQRPIEGDGFVHSNGRIEASEIEVATRQPGRVQHTFVQAGDFVVAGQRLALMQVATDPAERDEVTARRRQVLETVASAETEVAVRELECQAAYAAVQHHKSEHEAAQRRLARTEILTSQGALSQRDVDNESAMTRHTEAALAASELHHDAACAAVAAARMHVTSTRSAVAAVEADQRRTHNAFLAFELTAPRDGRVQDWLAKRGDVLEAGDRVLKILDLADVHMSFSLPEAIGRRVALGSDVRIVLDGEQQLIIPARVSSLASVTSVPPDTPATAPERSNRRFQVRAEIDRQLLRHHLQQVTRGRSGVAWVRVDPEAEWPAALSVSPGLIVRARS
jgi:HlyD family secretion protein